MDMSSFVKTFATGLSVLSFFACLATSPSEGESCEWADKQKNSANAPAEIKFRLRGKGSSSKGAVRLNASKGACEYLSMLAEELGPRHRPEVQFCGRSKPGSFGDWGGIYRQNGVELFHPSGQQNKSEYYDRNRDDHCVGKNSFQKRQPDRFLLLARCAVDDLDIFRMRKCRGKILG